MATNNNRINSVKFIHGKRALRRLLKGTDTTGRVLLARRLADGLLVYVPSPDEAAERVRVSSSYLRTLRRLGPNQRAAVELGMARLSTFHKEKAGVAAEAAE